VRGSSAPDAELAYILRHARPSGLVVQDPATLQRLLDAGALGGPGAPALKFAVVLWPEAAAKAKGRAAADGAAAAAAAADALAALAAAAPCPVASLQDVLAAGRAAREGGAPFQPYAAGRDDVATLVYTSGTTGEARRVLAGGRGEGAGWRLNAGPASGTVVNDKVTTCDDPTPPRATPQTPAAPPPPGHPKGVMLTHGNLRSQIDRFPYFLEVGPGEAALNLLPSWHIYQRTAAAYLASRAAKMVRTPGRARGRRRRGQGGGPCAASAPTAAQQCSAGARPGSLAPSFPFRPLTSPSLPPPPCVGLHVEVQARGRPGGVRARPLCVRPAGAGAAV
jgi:acyl-CoA synthetase (AMP-forming)/AMP-acid ligase II